MHGWLIGFAVAIGGTTMKCCKLVALAPHIAPRFIEISWLGSTRSDSYIRRTDMTSVGSYIGENNCCQIENLIKSKCPQLPNLRSGFHEPRNLDICIHLIANKLFYNQGICGFNRQKRMVTSAWVAWDDLSLSVFPVRVSCSKNLPAFVRCFLFSDKYICDMFNIQKKKKHVCKIANATSPESIKHASSTIYMPFLVHVLKMILVKVLSSVSCFETRAVKL